MPTTSPAAVGGRTRVGRRRSKVGCGACRRKSFSHGWQSRPTDGEGIPRMAKPTHGWRRHPDVDCWNVGSNRKVKDSCAPCVIFNEFSLLRCSRSHSWISSVGRLCHPWGKEGEGPRPSSIRHSIRNDSSSCLGSGSGGLSSDGSMTSTISPRARKYNAARATGFR